MASFAHFVGVRRSCRALQFILTATEAAIATQKPNGKPVSADKTKRIKRAIFLKMLRSKVMASFAHFVGVRRSCRALQFILTATEAAIATQKPNGKPVSALTSTRQASFCQYGRSLPSPPEISAFYSRLNHAYMHPLTCVKYGAAPLAIGRRIASRCRAAPPVNIGFASV